MNEDWGHALLMTQLSISEVNPNTTSKVFADICTEMIDCDAQMNKTMRPDTQGIFGSPFVLKSMASPSAEMPCDEKGGLFMNPISNHKSHTDL